MTIPASECEQIIEWIKHKHMKLKDWLLIIAFDYASISDFDPRKL